MLLFLSRPTHASSAPSSSLDVVVVAALRGGGSCGSRSSCGSCGIGVVCLLWLASFLWLVVAGVVVMVHGCYVGYGCCGCLCL